MPGMMDTVLNIGLCSATIPGLLKKTNNPRFVYDSYRRLIMMYADVVMENFTPDSTIHKTGENVGLGFDPELTIALPGVKQL